MGVCPGALEPGGLHHGDAQDILGLTGEIDVVYLVIGDGLVGEDALVYEGLKLCGLHAKALENPEGRIVLVADKAKEKVVRADAVRAGAHSFLAGVFDDHVKVVGNLKLHICLFMMA